MTDPSINKPPPDDDVLITEFWANRRGESIRIQIRSCEGRRVIDLRRFYTDKEGILRPTRNGLTLAIGRLPELAKGISKASATAIYLGLIRHE
jgi:Transcriptional Coactivator p15 (PC4)